MSGVSARSFSRTVLQEAAVKRLLSAGFVVTREQPSKVEMRSGGQVVVVWMDGSVRRGESGFRKVVRRTQ